MEGWSMVIYDGDVFGTGWRPLEDDAPLLVDANGVVTDEIALEGFEPIARRDCHIVEVSCVVQLDELA